MISNLSPVEVDPRTASRDFWARYHAYRRIRLAETRPEDPFEFKYRYEAAREGVLLSWFQATTVKPSSPEYESNKHILWADASVRKDYRCQGIGRSWIPLALELMDRHGCTTLSTGTEEESGHAFLAWMGAENRFTGAENRLELSAVDWGMVRRWAEDGPRLSPTSTLEVYDGRMPRELWDDD